MKINSAKVRHHQVQITHQVKTAFGAMNERHGVFLVLEDTDGHRGVGESWVNFPAWGPWERAATLERFMVPFLEKRQIDDIPAFVSELYRASLGAAQQSGTVGPLIQALCAVELALWDLAAQRAQVPLAHLLFKNPFDRVRVYASGISSATPRELIDEHLACGVTLFKLKLGFGDREDRRNLQSLWKHLGGQAEIAVDVNRAWSLQQALEWLDILADYNIQWLEEPLRIEEEDRLDVLWRRRIVPIAGGENTLMPPGCNLGEIASLPVDIIQPDLTKYAPLHVSMQLLDAATAKGKRVIPHFLGSAPGQAVSLHFAAGCVDGLVEWDINQNPLRTAMFEEPFQIRDGTIRIPTDAGLGWGLKRSQIP